MSVLLTFLGNGRDLLDTIGPNLDHIEGNVNYTLVFDDSGDSDYRGKLRSELADVADGIVHVGEEAMGFNAAMRTVLQSVSDFQPTHWLHFEEDMLLTSEIVLEDWIEVVDTRGLLQLATLRQSWWGNELEHGGVIPARIAAGGGPFDYRNGWVEHRDHWTLSPFLAPGWIAEHGWPRGQWSESQYGAMMLGLYPERSVAYWGDGVTPNVEHIGVRTGHSY
jgi:hypothetical protein